LVVNEHVDHRLTAFHDGALDPAESERIRAHLESCTACRSAYEEHLQFEALLNEAVQTAAPPAFMWTRVSARLRERSSRRFTFRLAGGMVLASAVGIALSLTVSTQPPLSAIEEDLWSAFDYSLVDGPPAALVAFDTKEQK
jgi:anti-sigma factor RsiW